MSKTQSYGTTETLAPSLQSLYRGTTGLCPLPTYEREWVCWLDGAKVGCITKWRRQYETFVVLNGSYYLYLASFTKRKQAQATVEKKLGGLSGEREWREVTK